MEKTEFVLNKNGQVDYGNTRDIYVETIKDLCLINNIKVSYIKTDKEAELYIAAKDGKGIYISSNYQYPFFLDYDDNEEFSRDFPPADEAFCRIYNLQHLIDFDLPFDRKKVMDRDYVVKQKNIIKKSYTKREVEALSYLIDENTTALRRKSGLVFAYTVIKQASDNDKEIYNEMKEILKKSYKDEDTVGSALAWIREVIEVTRLGPAKM